MLTLKEVGEVLRISETTLRCWIDTILDTHNKGKLDFYTFIWEYFGVSPTEYKHSKDKFKRTMMSEYENYLEEENY